MLGNHSSVDKCSEEEMQQHAINNSSSNIPITHDQQVLETAELAKVGQKRSRKDGKSVGGGDGSNGGGGGESKHEMHTLIERERRMKMRNMFSSLHALLPQLPLKASGSSNQFPEALSVEETFKLAVGEINLWLLTC
ncbi:hypothetical protein Dsin_003232 [Dipteronia sinensis]|uniref:BHLH domain-containing protein n=1 Tax=Dipteronia sinensis TaxID=43782 RepID=A0AAE0EK62_9ROSI|nr:hypothetical protein Dsin_003232 [Dipteronia sinensis]